MTEGNNSLYPSFVIIDYHSAYAPHKMTIPTTQWFAASLGGSIGSYIDHDGDPVDAEAMINDLVDLMAVFFLSTTHFDLATVYTMAAPTGAAIPRGSVALTQVGSSSATGLAKAIQTTINMRTSGLKGGAKLVFLDAPLGSAGFDKLLPSGFSSALNALVAKFTDRTAAWICRNGAIVDAAISVTFDLNDKLRKEYRMV